MIYEPSEDSYLLSETLKKELPSLIEKNAELKVLEVGVGSSFQLETLFSIGFDKRNIFGCDINDEAVEHCKKLGFNCIKSNLLKNINKKFDIIVFNPPYLPLDESEPQESREATTGGKKGNEITIDFLKQAKKNLKTEGIVFVMTSSLSEKVDFESLGYKSEIVGSKKLFFEELFVWKLSLKSQ